MNRERVERKSDNTENNQRAKLFLLYEILSKQSGKENPIKTEELLLWLHNHSVTCDRRTLPKDIALLNSYGYDIRTVKRGHSNAFYMVSETLTVPEIRLLINEVNSTSVLPEKQTRELIGKIAARGGTVRTEILDSVVSFNTRKHSNEEIYRTIMEIGRAISIRKKVEFRYFDLNEIHTRNYRMDGAYYDANPIAVVPYEDNYYFITYTLKHEGLTVFRIDRISDLRVTDADFDPEARRETNYPDLEALTTEAFKMYAGPMKRIRLQFDRELIGAVYDHFGEDCTIMRVDADTFEFYGQVRISPTLWGWIFQFGNRMKIIGPKKYVDEYQKILREVQELY